MFIDYQTLVLEDYNKKKITNNLSFNLMHPSPANIKAACKKECALRYNKKDEQSLNAFFGQCNDEAGYLKAIEKLDRDKFKPVLNFINSKTSKPDEKIVELLAWLIDFNPRPFEFGKKYDTAIVSEILEENDEELGAEVNTNAVEDEQMEEEESEEIIYSSPVNEEQQPTEENTNSLYVESQAVNKNSSPGLQTSSGKRNFNLKKNGVFAAIFSLVVGVGGYWRLHNTTNNSAYGTTLSGQEKCIYWAGDHYEPILCNQRPGDKSLIPFDSVKLNNLKKINRPDTITPKAKGYVWYSKINGKVEFFTFGGCHPIDIRIRLKPITDYIIKKYILGKKVS